MRDASAKRQASSAHEHALALALKGRCAFCAEIADDTGVLSERACTNCGGQFANGSTADAVMDAYRRSSLARLGLVLGLTSLASLLLGLLLPLLGTFAIPLGFIGFRLSVVSPALYLTHRRRRIVSRWTLRMFMASGFTIAGAVLTLASAVPIIGAAVAAATTPVTLAFIWLVGRRYLLWQLGRERRGVPVSKIEMFLLGGTLLAVFGMAVLTVLLVAFTFEAIEWVVDGVLDLLTPDASGEGAGGGES